MNWKPYVEHSPSNVVVVQFSTHHWQKRDNVGLMLKNENWLNMNNMYRLQLISIRRYRFHTFFTQKNIFFEYFLFWSSPTILPYFHLLFLSQKWNKVEESFMAAIGHACQQNLISQNRGSSLPIYCFVRVLKLINHYSCKNIAEK